jgi:hypothetical protein
VRTFGKKGLKTGIFHVQGRFAGQCGNHFPAAFKILSRKTKFPAQFAGQSRQRVSSCDQRTLFHDQSASFPVKNHFDRIGSHIVVVISRFYMEFSALIGLRGILIRILRILIGLKAKMFWILPF